MWHRISRVRYRSHSTHIFFNQKLTLITSLCLTLSGRTFMSSPEISNFHKEYIEQLIPIRNLEDLHVIDNLLYQVENEFTREYDRKINDAVCLKKLLSVLLTLSVESISSNKLGLSAISRMVDSNTASDLESANIDRYNSSYMPAIHQRALSILGKYKSSLENKNSRAYEECKLLFLEFLVLKTSKRVLREKLHAVNYDIILHFKFLSKDIDVPSAPPPSVDGVTGKEDENTISDGEVAEEISDSEEDLEILSQPHILREVRRITFEPSLTLTGSGRSSSDLMSSDNITASLFENMPHLEATRSNSHSPIPQPRLPPDSKKTKHSRSKSFEKWEPEKKKRTSPSKKEKENIHLKIFEEDLLSWKLNPVNPDQQFDFWKLLQWCFNCNNRVIYRNYRNIISWMVDYLAINLNHEIGVSESVYDLLTEECTSTKGVLLTNLLHQLGPSKRDWNDRLVEFTMLGLLSTSKVSPCYKRERRWKDQGLTAVDIPTDSLLLRLRILLLVYYRETKISPSSCDQIFELLHNIIYKLPAHLVQALFVTSYQIKDVHESIVKTFLYRLAETVLERDFQFNGIPSLTTSEFLELFSDELKLIEIFEYLNATLGDEFICQWEIFKFLSGWIFRDNLFQIQSNETDPDLLDLACKADRLQSRLIIEFTKSNWPTYDPSKFQSLSFSYENMV